MTKSLKTLLKPATILYTLLLALLMSCSDNDYINTVPSNSTAVLSIDLGKAEGIDGASLLNAVLRTKDITSCGISLKEKMYVFETTDGNIGMCASVSDADQLERILSTVAGKEGNSTLKKRDGMHFIMIGSWLIAHTDHALAALGPITPAARPDTERALRKMFHQDENHSIVSTPLYARLDTMSGAVSFVGQAQALPEKLMAPITLGAPKEADASQIMVAAHMSFNDNTLLIEGSTYSENAEIDKALKQAQQSFRSITSTLVGTYDANNVFGMFMNVKGDELLPLLQQNKSIQALLAGINTAIDMDNILRSVDGNITISVPTLSDTPSIQMTAKLSHSKWLADIGYWKQSCPRGTTLTTIGNNMFCYAGTGTSFFFGVTPQLYFVSGPTLQQCQQGTQPAAHPLPQMVANAITGSKMALLLNLKGFTAADHSGMSALIGKVLPNTEYIVYVKK